MYLSLIGDLCQCCSQTTNLQKKISFRARMAEASHNLMLEDNCAPCRDDDWDWERRITENEDFRAFMKELEIACYHCKSAGANNASVYLMVEEDMVEELKQQKIIEVETRELVNADGEKLLRPKLVTADRVAHARWLKQNSE
jgi:hypothetical protein